ncbi:hypothetical protein SARC_01632 [Sphaeroforma arctica JP610]|uniref:RGS domain-containing protein n=1 Tax=Sphaeroforma arctica JP610 TaxID=667725 RepID=A0A0L0GB26_9EUKA|nr:hypothetical protein SARC_01632 [Sphaeroforma arctica JP610]KNC86222.1 hypothetical protein SARC_01632 [Sphaeroforma arctica JP610]|eukprot:XP_014160124.1 hypothetical protein SARC_01632 [Sphaeroforma arctica JP610]
MSSCNPVYLDQADLGDDALSSPSSEYYAAGKVRDNSTNNEKLESTIGKDNNSAMTNSHNTSETKAERKNQRKSLLASLKYSWILAGVVYPILLGLCLTFYYLMYDQLASMAEFQLAAIADPQGKKDKVFAYACFVFTGTLLFGLVLILFFYIFWDEPEVRSRHHGFISHFCGSVVYTCVLGPISAAIFLEQSSIKAVDITVSGGIPIITKSQVYSSLVVWSTVLYYFGFGMIFSAVINRMRFMYLIFHKRQSQPEYWTGVVQHVLFFSATVTPSTLVCYYADVECTDAQSASGPIVFGATLAIEYSFYLFHTRYAHMYFVDWYGNLRCFIICEFGFWSPVVYGLITGDAWRVASATWLVGCFMAWLFGIDNFLFIIVKVLARALCRDDILENIDLQGAYFRAHENAKELLALLSLEKTREMFLRYAEGRHCEEQVEFLIDVQACSLAKDSENQTIEEKVVLIANRYVRPDSEKEINLPQVVRDKLLRKIEEKDYLDVATLFEEAFHEIATMISRNLILNFVKSPEYLEYAEKATENQRIQKVLEDKGMMASRGPDHRVELTERGIRRGSSFSHVRSMSIV